MYLISAINHHVSILHARIPLKYVKHIAEGPDVNVSDPTFPEWYSLEVQRSKWYDLFNADDRMQAARALWAIMGYLMRDVEAPEEDVPMTTD